MKKKSLDLSKRLDSLTLDIFQSMTEIARQLNISFFIVGATTQAMPKEFLKKQQI